MKDLMFFDANCSLGKNEHGQGVHKDELLKDMDYFGVDKALVDYAGPLAVSAGGGKGLDFGAGLVKMDLSVENLSKTRVRKVGLRLAASEAAPEGEEQVAGAVPLHLADGDGWKAFSALTVELGPGETWSGTFGVHREEMEYREAMAETNRSYQSVLQVRDAEGKIAIDVPVRAVRESAAVALAPDSIHSVAAAQAHPTRNVTPVQRKEEERFPW